MLQRSENTLKMAEEALQWLNPKETTLQTLTEVSTRLALCWQLLEELRFAFERTQLFSLLSPR